MIEQSTLIPALTLFELKMLLGTGSRLNVA